MLTEQQEKAREGKLTASRVACLMRANEAEIYNLWLELIGDPDWKPMEDLEDKWIVKLGEATEQLNLDWTERSEGPITRRGDVVTHHDLPWAACTLDGWMENHQCPIEAKHNNGFEPVQQVIDRYQPQMHWQMLVTVTKQCGISIIRGTKEPEFYLVDRDGAYANEIVRRAKDFMRHVENLTPPVVVAPAVVPVFEAIKTIDMSLNNMWVTAAVRWRDNREAHKAYEFAGKELKSIVPDDVKEAFGHGVRAKRSKTGSLTIRLDNGEE